MKLKNIGLTLFIFLAFLAFNSEAFARRMDIEIPKTTSDLEYDEFEDDYDLDYEPNETKQVGVDVWDPWEKMNRKIYKFNEFLLTHIARPLYYNVYVKITTPGMRKSVNNIVMNFRMPIIFANYILQLDFKNAAKSLYSFTLNTTYGILGVYDVAGHQGVVPPRTDLGITLAKYHVPAGPFLMLPFLGPNDLRGTVTWGVELAVDPLEYNVFRIGGKKPLLDDWVLYMRSGLYVIDNASFAVVNFYDLMTSSFDPYTLMKNAYGQSQNYKINKPKGE